MSIINIPLVVLLLSALTHGDEQQVPQQPVLICAIDATAAIRKHGTNFTVEDLDPKLCTHIIYREAAVDPENHDIKPDKPAIDLYDKGGLGLYNKTMKLKEANPQLKIILQITRWEDTFWENSTVSTEMIISTFTKNAVKYLQIHGFDGMSFYLGIHPDEYQMIQELREEFNRHGLLLTTIKFPSTVPRMEVADLTKDLSEKFDFVIIGEHWSLDSHETRIFSTMTGLRRVISNFKELGISTERLVVAIPTFVVSFRLCNESDTGISGAICDDGNEGLTQRNGVILTYSEMMYKMRNASEGWSVQRDSETGILYGHSNSLLWASFEDPASVRAKVQYALDEKLAGVAIITVDTDDIEGYNEEGIKLPLTTAIHDALRGPNGE